MRLRVRAIRLRVSTADGAFGRTVTFTPGFNVVRGGNSRGKTQVVNGIIYALGLERMLQARANTPLGSALTSEVRITDDDQASGRQVLKSWVAVELENSQGRTITAQRYVRHPRFQQNLVTVWNGPALTDPQSASPSGEYFLHSAGSASRDLGFHKLLTEMLDWSLPQVATYAGASTTLYLDVIFPFLIVDQQSWGLAGPRRVGQYQIREPLRRSTEFLLFLAGPVAEARRADLEQSMSALRTRWAALRTAVETLAGAAGGRVAGVPEHAAGAQARSAAPVATNLDDAGFQLLEDGEWVLAETVISRLANQLREAQQNSQRRLSSGLDEHTQRELDATRSELADLLAASHLVEEDLSVGEAQLAALDRRLSMLQEERDRNRDVRTLVRLGSDVAASHLADHNCPTCRQSLDPIESADLGPVLDVDETISLLNAQISTTQKMRDSAHTAVNQASNAYTAMQRQADQLRTRLKALQSDAVAPADFPSTGDVTRLVTLQLRHDELVRTQESLDERFTELADIAERIAKVRAELGSLPTGVPEADAERLLELTTLMRQRLVTTRFDSYNVAEVGLDPDSLRPSRSGFDMDTDVSASDVVRIKVAYLDSIRAIGQSSGRHPGLLILDEPRQQDIDRDDYAAMLQYLADDTDEAGQTIITSATPRWELDQLIGTTTANVIDIGDARLLRAELTTDMLDGD